MSTRADVERAMKRMLAGFGYVDAREIPRIDLYMDQVLTFMGERLRGTTRNPDTDKILTKAMINNYVKNKILIPPVKKKYSTDHVLLLIVVYYMKNFLMIEDIHKIIGPVSDKYARAGTYPVENKKGGRHGHYTLADIYSQVQRDVTKSKDRLPDEIREKISIAENSFQDAPEEDREMLQRFNLICQLCADIYMRKLLIEKLVDDLPGDPENSKTPKGK